MGYSSREMERQSKIRRKRMNKPRKEKETNVKSDCTNDVAVREWWEEISYKVLLCKVIPILEPKEIPEVVVSGWTQTKLYSNNTTNIAYVEGQSNATEMMYSYSLEGTKVWNPFPCWRRFASKLVNETEIESLHCKAVEYRVSFQHWPIGVE